MSISSGSTVIGSSSMSGVTPTPWIETSPGVRYCAMVSFSAALSGVTSGNTSRTLPLPNVGSPTKTARSWFLSAPATISLALADEVERLRALPARRAVARVAMHPNGDLGAGVAAQALDGVVERHVERRFVVDLGDAVEPKQARAAGGRVGHRVHYRQHLVAD